ncbi:MAG: glycosyltransferase [Thermacetogeniaceae bacterium]
MKGKTTVLLALMRLDIGGAETHVVVLARHLVELGYRVVVASNGGRFEKVLEKHGIRHYRVPLHNTKLSSVLKSVLLMRRIVREEGVEIIHAHARIPAFVAAVMGRPRHVHLITTAHSNFMGLRRLTRWGEKTIAVSEDIRDHLISYFRVKPERIVVIPNGIDTEFFSPEAGEGLEREEGTTLISLVSRLDGKLADVAVQLITACDLLCDSFPGLRLFIVGDGDGYEAVREMASRVNARRGREIVSLLGARTDVNRIMAGSDLVVGVSRVALEAMACARPVLLAGGQGFGGLLDKDNVWEFQRDNFTGRCAGAECSVERLVAALKEFFGKDEEWRRETGLFLRQLVVERYDSRAMAREVARVYEEIMQKGMDRG